MLGKVLTNAIFVASLCVQGCVSTEIADTESFSAKHVNQQLETLKQSHSPGKQSPNIVHELSAALTVEHHLPRVVSPEENRHYGKDKCSLRTEQIIKYLDPDARTWLIDDDTLVDVDNDLQSIFVCTKKGDIVFFNVTQTIQPKGYVTIRWDLILSTLTENTELVDDVFPETATKTTFTCPDREPVFLIRTNEILIANMVFKGCTIAENRPMSIVEIAECESTFFKPQSKIQHVTFEENTIRSGYGLSVDVASCSPLDMKNVNFSRNRCESICGALVFVEKAFKDAGASESKIKYNIFRHAPVMSSVTNLEASNNDGMVFHIRGENFVMTELSFSDNKFTNSVNPSIAFIHLIDSEATIKNSKFQRNEALSGATILTEGSNVVVQDSAFHHNTAQNGAGIRSYDSIVLLVNATMEKNNATENGGAIRVESSIFKAEGCTFSTNTADNGSVVYARDSTFHAKNSMVFGNVGAKSGAFHFEQGDAALDTVYFIENNSTSGGAITLQTGSILHAFNCSFTKNYGYDGGAVHMSTMSEATFDRCLFTMNTAKVYGGGIYSTNSSITLLDLTCTSGNAQYGGCLYGEKEAVVLVRRGTLVNNTADYGGAISLTYGASMMASYLFSDSNEAYSNGGSIDVIVAQLQVVDSTFQNGKARLIGGSTDCTYCSLYFNNVTFIHNEADFSGGALYMRTASDSSFSHVKFINNIANGNGYGGALFIYSSSVNISNANFFANEAGDGGALYLAKSDVDISDTEFDGCKASSKGGLIWTWDSNVTIKDSALRGGTAPVGSSVYLTECEFIASRVIFDNSTVSEKGDISSVDGTGDSTLTLSECTFIVSFLKTTC